MARRTQTNNAVEIDLQYPVEGVNEERSYIRQRTGTCVDARNVRAFDPSTDRARGGSRPGLSKWMSAKVAGAYPIQELTHLVTNDVIASTDTIGQFVYALASGSGFGLGSAAGASLATGGAVASFAFACSCWDDFGNAYIAERNSTSGATNIYKVTSAGVITWTIVGPVTNAGANDRIAGMTCIGTDLYVAVKHTTSPLARIYKYSTALGNAGAGTISATAGWFNETIATNNLNIRFSNAATNCICRCGTLIGIDSVGTGTNQQFTVLNSLNKTVLTNTGYTTTTIATTADSTVRSKVCSDGRSFFYVLCSITGASRQIRRYTTGGVLDWASALTTTFTDLCYEDYTPMLVAMTGTTPSVNQLSLTAGATVATADPGSQTTWAGIDTDNAGLFTIYRQSVASLDIMGVNTTFSTIWGPTTFANASHYGASVNKGKTVQASTGGNRQIRPLMVSNGGVYVVNLGATKKAPTLVTSGQCLAAHTSSIYSAPCNTDMFFVDGTVYKYYKSSTGAMTNWTPTAGSLPVDNKQQRARLICLWRGRIVLSGLPNDPQNWFMSKQYYPLNWNYAPATPNETMAAYGNNAEMAGLVGDFVNCLIPYTNDTMLFGCDHSIYLLNGDPAAGGQFDCVSRLLGMAWGRPFCQDPSGQVYFFSNDCAVYKMTPNSIPVVMSQQIRKRLQSINLSEHVIQLAWDMRNQGLAVWVTPLDETQETVNYFWEERVNAWWPDFYGNPSMNPQTVHVYDGDAPNDRVIWLGGQDGYVRVIDNDAAKDDTEDIASSITLGPLTTRQLDKLKLATLQPTLSEDSGTVNYAVHVGKTAEAALSSDPVTSGTWTASRNHVSPVNRSGFACYVKLSSTDRWALERITAKYNTLGPIRRRM